MDHNHDIEQRSHGLHFLAFAVFIFINFIMLSVGVWLSLFIIYPVASALGLFLAYFDNRHNASKDRVLYVLYALACAIAIFIFYWVAGLMVNQTVSGPRAYLGVIMLAVIGSGLIPGFLLIKYYQSIVNRRLEDAYWEAWDAKNGPNTTT